MAPTALKKLTASQTRRLAEIRGLHSRLIAKPRASLNKNIIQARINAVKQIWDEARGVHADIVARDDAEKDSYIIEDGFGTLEQGYEEVLDEFLTLLGQYETADQSTLLGGISNSTFSDSGLTKLPKISLPSFSGNYEDWASFRDNFKIMVHDLPRIADATRLQYLKMCLTGNAADLVKDVPTTNANYASTWKALEERYHNPRLIITKYLTAFMELPHLKKESAEELRFLIDEAKRIVRALRGLKMPVDHWDVWFVFLLSERLDPESRSRWESLLSEKERTTVEAAVLAVDGEAEPSYIPATFNEFVEFLETRAQTLGMLATERRGEKRSAPLSKSGQPRKIFHASPLQCPLCAEAHALMRCPQYKSKKIQDRQKDVQRLRLCFNCLGRHRVNSCTSSGRCSVCKLKHHSSLHDSSRSSQGSSSAAPRENQGNPGSGSAVVLHATKFVSSSRRILLATARVLVVGLKGRSTYVRALLDQGSEVSFVSEAIVQLLGLPKRRTHVPLSGLGASAAGTARSIASLTLRSAVDSGFQVETEMLVLPKLTSLLPSYEVSDVLSREQFSDVLLADPEFAVPKKIDMILGADLYGQLLHSGVKRFASSQLVAQNTVFGWIVSGPMDTGMTRRAAEAEVQPSVQALHCTIQDDLAKMLQRFWNLEEIVTQSIKLKPEDERCEKLFTDTHRRNAQGRFVVKLPLKPDLPSVAAESRGMALSSLTHLHRRFSRDSKLAKAYCEFMEMYEKLGHMTRVPRSEIHKSDSWYLPHHPVVQTHPLWKIRVVFDASRRTKDGQSLNAFLLAGPPLQNDLSLILLNWRRYRFAFTADIVKMFRQIQMDPEHQDYQRIVWSPDAASEPVDFRLTTVTYGTACAPYLSIRTLLQLVKDEGHHYPLGAHCLESETYVDDTFAGADDLSIAIQKRVELTKLLASAGIELDKWAANHQELLPESARHVAEKQIGEDESVKALGVHWVPSKDYFRFNAASVESLSAAYTKRSVLSYIARLFDPLGWLAPVTVMAKILMQDMWILKCDWDAPLPAEIRERWYEYCKGLSALPSLSIERWLGGTADSSYQIHGFSDASSRAYAAVVYLRIDEGNGHFRVSLLAAKSKVAPVKTVSIPNLELCGAALLVKLIQHVTKLDFLQGLPIFTWSDSQIVLMWLRKHPCHWKTFVANRVSLIQTELPSATWAHVPTKENPADLATRGVQPGELADSTLWWRGPAWLSMPPTEWPRPASPVQANHARPRSEESEILTRFSSLTRLVRVVALCRRALYRILNRRASAEGCSSSFLTTAELSLARVAVIRLSQADAFAEEIKLLRSGKRLPKGNRLSSLNPFIGKEDGLLRVGGRLTHSGLSFDQKHPPILSHNSALSLLFVRHAHHQCLHGGPTLTTSILMPQVWILGRNRLVKSTIRACVPCQRVKPHTAQQLMGELPADRVTSSRAFSHSGLDYAGPFQIRMAKGRGNRAFKGYIALFVCFSTRAIHLELVGDLTSASFICAFRRFVGRRGICANLYSDNGTNFQGADKELRGMFQRASDFYKDVGSVLANDGTNWTFIPPSAPHYGGLWEAGVKSVKHHLKRVVGEHILTFEEFSTVLVEIEACLNSRPLGALTADFNDLRALTPSHFLNEGVSVLLPEADCPKLPENRLTRFQLLQRIRNNFWKRWSTEYLLHLQQREKWRDPCENFALGQLVLVKDDRYPPSKWPLGRIVEVHPGPDGLVRVVTIKTATSSLRRHVARLCPLMLEEKSR